MGMYTRFHFAGRIAPDHPKLLNWLEKACKDDGFKLLERFDDDPFFELDRWPQVFWGGGAVGDVTRPPSFERKFDSYESNKLALNSLVTHTSLKNYGGECEAFVNWISQYIEDSPGTFLGYSLYEESRNTIVESAIDIPTLYYLGHPSMQGPHIPLTQSASPPF